MLKGNGHEISVKEDECLKCEQKVCIESLIVYIYPPYHLPPHGRPANHPVNLQWSVPRVVNTVVKEMVGGRQWESRRWDSEVEAEDLNLKLDIVSEFGRIWSLIEIPIVL